MSTVPTTTPADAEKRRAALSSVIWSCLLTGLKLVAGLATNSLGLLSEALHSALDLVAAGITYFAVRMSSRPPDRNHAYGYGKVENLSALIETMLLLLTCIWIVYEAVNRLFFSQPEVGHSLWGIGVILVSIAVDTSRARMLKRVAKKHNSQALEADALHFSTDILSSIVVLVGLLGLWGASYLQPGPLRNFLEKTDAMAALAVSGIVIWVGARLSGRAMHVLLDGGSKDFLERFEQTLAEKLPRYRVRKLRVRQSGSALFADVVLAAPAEQTVEASHSIAALVEAMARGLHPDADVTVQIEPQENTDAGLLATAQAVAAAHGLAVHSLVLGDRSGKPCAYLHVEAPGDMSLEAAHTLIDTFEGTLALSLRVEHVISHIEPEHQGFESAEPDFAPLPVSMGSDILSVLAAPPAFPEPYNLDVCRMAGRLTVSFDCAVSGEVSVSQAHTLSSRMERRLRASTMGIDRVNIHMEPENRRSTRPGE